MAASKSRPRWAAHTRIGNVWENHPPPPPPTHPRDRPKKAFDTIDHEIVLRKLANYGVDEHSFSWSTSYLSNRS